jgi:hypothetical protein
VEPIIDAIGIPAPGSKMPAMNRLSLALAAFAGLCGSAFGHEFVLGDREIPHLHSNPEFLLLLVLVATLAILRSGK